MIKRERLPVQVGNNTLNDRYDSSWDLVRSRRGNLPKSRTALDKKYQEWKKRNWMKWLKENLAFPLFDLEVTPKDDPNFWPVREYVVWDANR